jgi:MFS family permease
MNAPSWRTPAVVLYCGALVLCISLGIRHAFGLFLTPMSAELGWGRETFALTIAVQNLVWGLTQPIAGRIADRFGAGWVVCGGAVLYALGLYFMSQSTTERKSAAWLWASPCRWGHWVNLFCCREATP